MACSSCGGSKVKVVQNQQPSISRTAPNQIDIQQIYDLRKQQQQQQFNQQLQLGNRSRKR